LGKVEYLNDQDQYVSIPADGVREKIIDTVPGLISPKSNAMQ
jgi:hypothetical protein